MYPGRLKGNVLKTMASQNDPLKTLAEKFAQRLGSWQPYAIALLCTFLAIPATLAIMGVHERPFLEFFFIAVLVSTWDGGWKPGLLATVLTSLAGAYLVFPPIGSLAIVLYDAEVGADAQLGDLSVVMKGETLPGGTNWEGSPARIVMG